MKGIHTVLKISDMLPLEKFTIYGTWGQHNPRVLRQISEKHNIMFYPFIQNPEKIWRAAKLFLMPSRCPEGFARGLIEAGLHKIPSIASLIGSIPKTLPFPICMIDDYENAVCWVERISKIMENSSLYNNLQDCVYSNSLSYCGQSSIDALDILTPNVHFSIQ
ncbi:MAG: glycosyltransferase [Clostridiales bacterium]|jgi:glycosyltransferase involved in cell wall biosynthesis|nr:glycosyltransferase [Clostridiales bacterium]